MALQSKSISANGSKGHHKFTLTVTENSTSTSANTSSISWTFKLSPVVSSYRWNYSSTVPVTYTVTINGTKYSGNIMTYDGSSTVTVKSGSATITHGTDGTKSISYSFSVSSLDVSYLPGSASASGSMSLTKIPRYATSVQSLSSKTETSITMNWSSDNTIDYIQYSTDNGSTWKGKDVTDGKSGSYTISGLSANTTYKIKTRVRRKDSQLTTDSSALSVMTYNYPFCTEMPNFTIGDTLTLKFYNPLNRNITVNILGADNSQISHDTTTGTSISGYNNSTVQDKLYKSIPNAKSGTYKVKVTYGSSTITKTGGTYSIKGIEIPSINPLWYDDSNPNTKQITGNTLHIVQNLSNLLVTYTEAEGNNYASILKYTFELNGVKKESTEKGGTVDFGKINSATDLTLIMTVTDSRGLTSEATVPIRMLAHSKPTALVTLERLNNYEDESYLTIDGSVSSVNNKNTMEIKYRYKESGGTYNSFVTVDDKAKQTFDLDKNKSYIFNVVITDAFGSTYNKEHALGKGVFPLFIDTVLNSIGINKLPTHQNALEIDGKIYGSQNHLLWQGEEQMDGNTKITLAEPVSEQANGIVVVFSYYSADGTVQNYQFQSFFISKYVTDIFKTYNSGKGIGNQFALFSQNFDKVATKYLYINDNTITGLENNTANGTNANTNIKYDNSRFVLRFVIGV